jgi:hypothetical protein
MVLAHASSTCSFLPNKANRLRKLDSRISVIFLQRSYNLGKIAILLANLNKKKESAPVIRVKKN